MSLLLISHPGKEAASPTDVRKKLFPDKSKAFTGNRNRRVDLYGAAIDEALFAKRESVLFIQARIGEFKNIPSLLQPKYDGWQLREGKGDLVFEGTDFTLTRLINSFLYSKKATSSARGGEGPYGNPYGPSYPPVILFIFVRKITAQISDLATRAIGIDVFGRTHRKAYVILIPLTYNKRFIKEKTQEIPDKSLSYLARLLARPVKISDVLAALPGSRLFAQREQMDGDGDEADLKNSLTAALALSVGEVPAPPPQRCGPVEQKGEEPERGIVREPSESEKTAGGYDEVNCTVYAPGAVARGNAFLIQVFAHTYVQGFDLDGVAKYADADARKRGSVTLEEKVLPGSRLDFQLHVAGLQLEEDSLSIKWNGKLKSVQFVVNVPEEYKLSTLVGQVLVSHDSVPVGQMRFIIEVKRPVDDREKEYYAKPGSHRQAPFPMERFEKAFISYASQDRAEVLKRVQMLNTVKLDFFQDLLTLEPGDEWEAKIYDYIDQCDVFFIFWSKAASESVWVKKETLYALKMKKGDRQAPPAILPVIIEGPPPAKPPEELNFLHFNDKFIYFINPG